MDKCLTPEHFCLKMSALLLYIIIRACECAYIYSKNTCHQTLIYGTSMYYVMCIIYIERVCDNVTSSLYVNIKYTVKTIYVHIYCIVCGYIYIRWFLHEVNIIYKLISVRYKNKNYKNGRK